MKKKRVREFYEMSASDAYSILETIAEINGLKYNLVLIEPTGTKLKMKKKQQKEE